MANQARQLAYVRLTRALCTHLVLSICAIPPMFCATPLCTGYYLWNFTSSLLVCPTLRSEPKMEKPQLFISWCIKSEGILVEATPTGSQSPTDPDPDPDTATALDSNELPSDNILFVECSMRQHNKKVSRIIHDISHSRLGDNNIRTTAFSCKVAKILPVLRCYPGSHHMVNTHKEESEKIRTGTRYVQFLLMTQNTLSSNIILNRQTVYQKHFN